MSAFTVEILTASQVMEVYPLIRQLVPGLGLNGWRRYAGALLRDRSRNRGVALVRRAGQRFPCGLSCFRVDHDLRHGRLLTAEHALVMATFDAREAFAALVRGVQQLATERGCQAVRWLLADMPAETLQPEIADIPVNALVWTPLHHPANQLSR
jgi:hypothetical protein